MLKLTQIVSSTQRSRAEAAGVLGGAGDDIGRVSDLRCHRGVLHHRSGDSGLQVQRPDHDAVEFPRHSIADELDGPVLTLGGANDGRQRLRALEGRALAGRHGESLWWIVLCSRSRHVRVARLQPFPLPGVVFPAPAYHSVGAAALRGKRSAAQTLAWRH